MSDQRIIQFIPRAGRNASKNIADFIDTCKFELEVFGKNLEWEKDIWDLSEYLQKPGKTHRQVFSFINYDTAGNRSQAKSMSKPYIDFAKAYMRYGYGFSKNESHGNKLAAIRALEKALVEISVDGIPMVQNTNPNILNRAANLLTIKSPSGAYNSGCHLEKIAKFLCDHSMVTVRFSWVNPIPKKTEVGIRVGEEFDRRRKEKLPSKSAMKALPIIFRAATGTVDIIISSIVAILLCAPDRFSEVFRMLAECEHHDINDEGNNVYGLRWTTAKKGDPQINWIPTHMVDVCKEAIDKLKEQTKEARRIAKWYEENPYKLYLPEDLKDLRFKEYLCKEDLCQLLGCKNACSWASDNNLTTIKVPPKGDLEESTVLYRFEDFEKIIVDMLPAGFPYIDAKSGLMFSESLLVFHYNLFHPGRSTCRCMFQTISINAFNDQIGARVQHGVSSIFSRNGYTEPDGSPIKLSSHKFRHFLVTLALNKRLSYVVATLWRKSKDVKQTRAYDHISGEELVELLRQATPEKMSGHIAEIEVNPPVSREEFIEMMYPCVHTTQFGFCVHDWQLLPCQKLADCLACTEHICIKGDQRKTERITQELRDAEAQLERDEAAVERGEIGPDVWVKYNRKQVERLRQLVTILEDSTIAEGTIIQITNPDEFTFIGQAVNERRQLNDSDAQVLNHIRMLQTSAGANMPTTIPL